MSGALSRAIARARRRLVGLLCARLGHRPDRLPTPWRGPLATPALGTRPVYPLDFIFCSRCGKPLGFWPSTGSA
jgi:hypothetical protein